MIHCLFAADLHGREDRYNKLARAIAEEMPAAVFLGGDLLPSETALSPSDPGGDFVRDFLFPLFHTLRDWLAGRYPRVFLIPGNDDPGTAARTLLDGEEGGVWSYMHGRRSLLDRYDVYGYSCVPPTPFLMKDWEKYDVSRYVDPGSISPEEGWRSLRATEQERRYGTIQKDLQNMVSQADVSRSVFLFHAPPYGTNLDRAALDGRSVEGVPLDVHVGSVAIRRFIEERQPLLTLHGHIHESARITGSWRDRIGRTHAFSAAHDGPELALVRFDLEDLEKAERFLL
jgi:Icc-related predicted phosphoesterase